MKKDHPLLGLLITVLVFVGAVSLIYFKYLGAELSGKNNVARQSGDVGPKNQESNQETYVNNEYGFEITYPSSDVAKLNFVQSDQADKPDYLRIQNYRFGKNSGGLTVGEYYLEMYVIGADEPCTENAVVSPVALSLSTAQGYKGTWPGAQNAGENMSAMCLYKDGRQFYAVVTESGQSSKIANSIFDSIKFVN